MMAAGLNALGPTIDFGHHLIQQYAIPQQKHGMTWEQVDEYNINKHKENRKLWLEEQAKWKHPNTHKHIHAGHKFKYAVDDPRIHKEIHDKTHELETLHNEKIKRQQEEHSEALKQHEAEIDKKLKTGFKQGRIEGTTHPHHKGIQAILKGQGPSTISQSTQ